MVLPDGSVMRRVRAAEGWEAPRDGTQVTVTLQPLALDGQPADSGGGETVQATLGNGELCDAAEFALRAMARGELVELKVSRPESWASGRHPGLARGAAREVVLRLHLQAFENGVEPFRQPESERLACAAQRKDVGSALFREGRVALALQRYTDVLDLFHSSDTYEEAANRATADDLVKVCRLNRAACCLKLEQFAEAHRECSLVLEGDQWNSKALFRRAQAGVGLRRTACPLEDLHRLLGREPHNVEAKALLRDAEALQRELEGELQGTYVKMVKALGVPDKVEQVSEDPDEDWNPVEQAGADATPAEEEEGYCGLPREMAAA